MGCSNSFRSNVQVLSVLKTRVSHQVPWVVGMAVLALGLLAAPCVAPAAVVITDSGSTTPFQALSPSPTASADGLLSQSSSFTITANPANNSVLIVNVTRVSQLGTGNDAVSTVTWNGTPLTRAISQ